MTADSDGQHAPEDVVRCMELLAENPEALVLGCRTFDRADIPWRSRFGNGWMRTLFRVVSGRRFDDTQTGLRGIPAGFMRELLDVPGERFEFESEMLLRLGRRPLVQFPIRTIYENRNAGSHFRPFADSAKILRIVLRSAVRAPCAGVRGERAGMPGEERGASILPCTEEGARRSARSSRLQGP